MARFNWTEDEMVLAADLADDRGWKGPNSSTPEVVELSKLLNCADFHPMYGRSATFRSPASVSLKVNNLIGSHPNAPSNPLRTSKGEVEIVRRFVENRKSMKKRAAEIRGRVVGVDR